MNTYMRSALHLLLFLAAISGMPAHAQIVNGQLSSGPGAPPPLSTSTSSSLGSSATSHTVSSPVASPAAIRAPGSTVGNTPSSLQSGTILNQGSGYSARGATVNGNVNNTNVGGRSLGMPLGSGSQSSRSAGVQTNGSNMRKH